MEKKEIIATHHAPDLDAVAAITLFHLYGNKRQRRASVTVFLRKGDEILPEIPGIIVIDRGRKRFDHHGRKGRPETSTSLVAKKLKIEEKKEIQRLLRKVERCDLQGESLPFDISDILKCMQRTGASNEEIVEIGTRIVKDCLAFSEKGLKRNHSKTLEIVEEFLKDKEIVPPKFQGYCQKLNNPRFQRPFDLTEIVAAELYLEKDEKKVKVFIKKLLDFIYQDSLNYLKAKEEVKRVWKSVVRGKVIVAAESDNPRFKDAARNELRALITIQRNSDGHTQIYFDSQRIEDRKIETLISTIRLEECLIQGREIPRADLRRPGRIEEIPEWYYYKAPKIPGKKKKPGRFLLNGSLTSPDVPASKIPLETLQEIAEKVLLYQPFNWVRWKAERMAHYMSS